MYTKNRRSLGCSNVLLAWAWWILRWFLPRGRSSHCGVLGHQDASTVLLGVVLHLRVPLQPATTNPVVLSFVGTNNDAQLQSNCDNKLFFFSFNFYPYITCVFLKDSLLEANLTFGDHYTIYCYYLSSAIMSTDSLPVSSPTVGPFSGSFSPLQTEQRQRLTDCRNWGIFKVAI